MRSHDIPRKHMKSMEINEIAASDWTNSLIDWQTNMLICNAKLEKCAIIKLFANFGIPRKSSLINAYLINNT